MTFVDFIDLYTELEAAEREALNHERRVIAKIMVFASDQADAMPSTHNGIEGDLYRECAEMVRGRIEGAK